MLIYLLLTSQVTLGEPLNLVVIICAPFATSPAMLVAKTNTWIHPEMDPF